MTSPSRGRQLTEKLIAALAAEVAAAGARFVLVTMPDPRQIATYVDPAGRDVAVWNKRLASLCARKGHDCLDLLPYVQAEVTKDPAAELFFPRDGHMTSGGHALVASVLGELIEGPLGSVGTN